MKRTLRVIAFLLLVFFMLVFLSSRLQTEQGKVISELEFTTFDNVLWTPEEYAAQDAQTLAKGYVGWDYDYNVTYDEKPFSRVRTNVLELQLEPGQVYGIHCEQFTYASKLYVDGKLLASLGQVSAAKEGYVPRTGSVTVYFTAGETTQILTQRCNLEHAKWNAFQLYLGPQDVITRQVELEYLGNVAMLAFLLTITLVNLGMFTGLPQRREYLWSALFSVALLINASFSDPKLVMLLFPELNWYLGHKLETSAIIFMGLFLFLYFRACFGKEKKPWITVVGLAVLLVAAGFILVLPVEIYSKFSTLVVRALAGLSVMYLVYLAVHGIRSWKQLLGYQKFSIAGLGIVILTALIALFHIGPSHLNTLPIGLILFELVLTLGLSLEFRDVQSSYERSRQIEEQLRSMNVTLEQNQEIQENFLSIMNHEMRTPLTVIAGYADLSSRQLEQQGEEDEELLRGLNVIKQEALRLGRIVAQSESGVRTAIAFSEIKKTNLQQLLLDAKDFCQPICEKRHNRLEIACSPSLNVLCMRDGMLQALYNLVINASRHTKDGLILLQAEQDGTDVLLRVKDDGSGMSEEAMQRAFERGYTTDGGHGLGLPLCREILERQNGSIWIERNRDRGITVCMRLPEASGPDAQENAEG